MLSRWRVKVSRTTPTWFHACEVLFLDAESMDDARRQAEEPSAPGESVEAWDIAPATPEMEARHVDWLEKCEAWIHAAKTASAKRGML